MRIEVRRASLVTGGFLVLILGIAVFQRARPESPQGAVRLEDELSPLASEAPAASEGTAPGPKAPAPSDREPVRRENGLVVVGRIRSSVGPTISGAEVSLTLPASDDAECEPVWRESDWG